MARYPHFISLLLVLLCLWINIWRYPSVWMMLQGQYVPQIRNEGTKETNGQKQPVNLPKKKEPEDSEKGLLVSKDPNNEGFRGVSYGDSTEGGLGSSSRAPAPVVPVVPKTLEQKDNSDQQTKAVPSKKKEKTGSGDQKEVFRNATWSKPVSSDKKDLPEKGGSEKKDSLGNDPSDNNPSQKEEDEHRFVSWETDPSVKEGSKIRNAFYVQTEETVNKTSFPVYVYRAPGEPGTSPMNIDQPSYGADTSSESAPTVLPVRFTPIQQN
ncbi:MAG: hypothetical protein Q4G69_05400 [Planctomycetia bacterium]|nr:hypothetical protein [Planctomycetia bacterium]